MTAAIGINWYLKFKKQIINLEERNNKLYNENQKMKRRLEKYEGSRQNVLNNNKKTA